MKPRTKRPSYWRRIFQRDQRKHDPLLVFNMSIFNAGNWRAEIFSSLKARENIG